MDKKPDDPVAEPRRRREVAEADAHLAQARRTLMRWHLAIGACCFALIGVVAWFVVDAVRRL